MLDLLTSSGNRRSERGLVRRIRYLLVKLTLAHARTMVVHSACCICLPAQVSIHRSARIGMALPLPAKLAYHVLARARTLVVHSACWICLLAQLTATVLGLVRHFRYLLCQPRLGRMPALWQCVVHAQLLTSPGSHRSEQVCYR